jgi:hypothetical protein
MRSRLALVAVALAPATSIAQPARVDSIGGAIRCAGEPVTEVRLEASGPQFGRESATSRLVTGALNALHATTRDRVLRPFLQLRVGGACTELRRTETERILRAQWFIQDASVQAYPDRGGVRIVVRTVDELAILANVRLRGSDITGFNVGSSNLLGRGLWAEYGQRDNGALRNSYLIRLRTATTFGRPIQTGVSIERFGLGSEQVFESRAPFFTDLQHFSARLIVGRDREFVPFLRRVDPQPLQLVDRKYGSLGAIARIGRPGALLVGGASVTYDDESVGGATIVTSTGQRSFPRDSLPPLPADPRTATRANLLFGGRAMRFLRVDGFDALTGAQDLRLGTQFSATLGRSLRLSGLRGNDYFLGGHAYAGWGASDWYAATEWIYSGRNTGAGWDGRVVSGRSAAMWKPWARGLTTVDVQFTSGTAMRVPFQLSFRDGRTGLRGYRDSRDGGDSRFIVRGEQRHGLGRPFGFGDVAAALWAQTGRLGAGSAPYGISTPWRTSIGTGLLVAVPPRSRRTYRVDVSWAANPDPFSRRWELRITSGNFTRSFWQDPEEARGGRERSLLPDLFSF